ncbi:MAG: DUF3488 domain-containing transglutaminase family protein [Xanthomonadales bacterium]|nr:DUF3488 domain-containing transglutaminase family protein [Xanthomonadales bacterium]
MRSPVLDPRQFDWTLAAFTATLAAHLLWLPPWFAAFLAGLLVARWLQRRVYARAWPVWIKLPLVGVVLTLVVFEFGNPFARQAGTAALIGLCTLKLIESERRRDGLLIMTVTLFLVSVQFLFNQGIGITLYMLLPTLLVFLALNEIAAPPGTRGGLASQIGSLGRELLLLLAVVLPLTLFLFVSVPRLSEPLWGTRENQWEARTGLSDTMSPGSITELLADDTPVMRVRFPDGPPARSSMYWRGPVLWRFDGTTWSRAYLGNPQMREGRVDGPQDGAADDLRYEVTAEPSDRRWMLTLDFVTGFPQGANRSLDGSLVRERPISSVYRVTARSHPDAPVPVERFASTQRRFGLELPPGLNPRSLRLAQSWRRELGDDPRALVERALRHIREGGFGYSLSPPPLVGAHRMDEFLFETRLGFCEHYAAAFVVLMRGAGVPARVVTGYLGGSYNRIGAYWVVRNSDAHAWAEVLVDGRGWVRVDPTSAIAPERIDQSGAFAGGDLGRDWEWLRSLRERVDAVQAWWNNHLVRFDHLHQQDFFSGLGIDTGDWKQLGVFIAGGLAGIGLLTAALFWLQRRRMPGDPALALYRQFLRRLRRQGLQPGASEGANDFGRRAAAALPALAQPIAEVVGAYEAARYGRIGDAGLPRLRTALAAFRNASNRKG